MILEKIAPLPWKVVSGSYPLGDTGDYDSYVEIRDAAERVIAHLEESGRIPSEVDALAKRIVEAVNTWSAEHIRHMIGNPAFAIDLNLSVIERRIKDGKLDDALRLIEVVRGSLERIKAALLDLDKPSSPCV